MGQKGLLSIFRFIFSCRNLLGPRTQLPFDCHLTDI